MSQSNKKKDIFFYVLLAIVCLLIIGTTVLFIIKDKEKINAEKLPGEELLIETMPMKKIKVREKLQINPVEIIKNEDNTVNLKGLKNKEITKKIDKYLNEAYNNNHNNSGPYADYNACEITFNYNNIFAFECGSQRKMINLINAEDITLEDIIIDVNELYTIIAKNSLENMQINYEFWAQYEEEFYETFDYDAKINAFLQDLKNNKYTLRFYYSILGITTDDDYEAVDLYEIKDILSFDKFLIKDDIYENEATYEYIFYSKESESEFKDLIDDKTVVSYTINNMSMYTINFNTHDSILDDERFQINIKNTINVINDNVIEKKDKYQVYDIRAEYYYYDTEKTQLVIIANTVETNNEDDFDTYILQNDTYNDNYTKKIIANIFIDKNNNFIYLSDDPYKVLEKDIVDKIYSDNPTQGISWAIDTDTKIAHYYIYDFGEAYVSIEEFSIPY